MYEIIINNKLQSEKNPFIVKLKAISFDYIKEK